MKTCKDHLRKMCISELNKTLSIMYSALAIDPFWGPCYSSLPGVVCEVIGGAAAEEEEAIGWMSPSPGAEPINSKGPRRDQ